MGMWRRTEKTCHCRSLHQGHSLLGRKTWHCVCQHSQGVLNVQHNECCVDVRDEEERGISGRHWCPSRHPCQDSGWAFGPLKQYVCQQSQMMCHFATQQRYSARRQTCTRQNACAMRLTDDSAFVHCVCQCLGTLNLPLLLDLTLRCRRRNVRMPAATTPV